MSRCTKCAYLAPQNSVYCNQCGSKLEWNQAPAPADVVPKVENKRAKKLGVGLGITAILISAIVFYVFYVPPPDKSELVRFQKAFQYNATLARYSEGEITFVRTETYRRFFYGRIFTAIYYYNLHADANIDFEELSIEQKYDVLLEGMKLFRDQTGDDYALYLCGAKRACILDGIEFKGKEHVYSMTGYEKDSGNYQYYIGIDNEDFYRPEAEAAEMRLFAMPDNRLHLRVVILPQCLNLASAPPAIRIDRSLRAIIADIPPIIAMGSDPTQRRIL
ncbi:MAG: hypothetical protein K0Q59_4628 [Paenibacillus sp.]|nr:hypothetical protein [Paenibacillus sp.]